MEFYLHFDQDNCIKNVCLRIQNVPIKSKVNVVLLQISRNAFKAWLNCLPFYILKPF